MPITKTGTMLVKIATPRWREIFQYLSLADQRRIQQSGIMKGRKKILAGMRRGNENIRNSLGYSRVDPGNISYEDLEAHKDKILDSMAKNFKVKPSRWVRDVDVRDRLDELVPGRQNILPSSEKPPNALANISPDTKHKFININNFEIPKQIVLGTPLVPNGKKIIKPSKKLLKTKNREMLDAFLERHELYEAQAVEKSILEAIESGLAGTPRRASSFIRHPGTLQSVNTGMAYTSHNDLSVLLKERRDLDTFTLMNNPAYRFVRQVRDVVERPYMDAAGGFDSAKVFQPGKPVDTFRNHERKFLRNSKGPVETGNDVIQAVKVKKESV